MKNWHKLSGLRIVATSLSIVLFAASPAHAVSKEMIQLQTQMQQVQDAIARLQQSYDQHMGGLKEQMQQTADSVNKMSVVVNGLQLKLQNQQDALGTKNDQLSGQMQSLNDSVDELKARIVRMDKMLADVQSQQQSNAAVLANVPQPGTAQGSTPAVAPVTAPSKPSPATTRPAATGDQQPAVGPSATELYRTAYGDYIAAKYPLAISEFQGLVAAYPGDTLSGNAYFYIGEIDMRTQKPTAAVKNYDIVLERYPDNQKIPAAHLHKGEALLAMKQSEAGIRELRALIQRYPNSAEASQAKMKIAAVRER